MFFLFCLFFAFLTFLRVPGRGRISSLRYSASSPPFPQPKFSHFHGSLYFSFLPVKQRDFPGNVRSGGCDSLPLVVAFTSKQRDSLLSYALHFLHIISHRNVLRWRKRAEKNLPTSLRERRGGNARKASAFSEQCVRLSRAATRLLNLVPDLNKKSPDKPTLHLSPQHEHTGL